MTFNDTGITAGLADSRLPAPTLAQHIDQANLRFSDPIKARLSELTSWFTETLEWLTREHYQS